MLFVMGVNLFSVRILLNALGLEGYGIYNVIAGVVAMLSTVSTSLSAATQRFFNIAISDNDEQKLSIIFNTCLKIYIGISLIILLIGETIGLWFVKTQLNIPTEHTTAVAWIYQFSIFTFISTMLSVPYTSAIIAHEDMQYYSYIGIGECLLKLIAAYSLYIINFNLLITYGSLIFIISILVFIAFSTFCRHKYKGCKIKNTYNKTVLKDMLAFSGWSFWGGIAGVLNNQGNNILINIFFTPAINAARTISFQICSAITIFVTTFYTAIRPPLMKSYANNQWEQALHLFNISNKTIYYLMILLCIPLFFNMEFILHLWLENVTPDMVLFTKLALIYAIINALNAPITTLIQARGTIKTYHLIVESIILLSLPLTYLLFKLNFAAMYTYIVSIIVFGIAHIIRLIIIKHYIQFISIKTYLCDFLGRAFIVTATSCIMPIYLHTIYVENTWYEFVISMILTLITSLLSILYIGLNSKEKSIIFQLIKNKIKK